MRLLKKITLAILLATSTIPSATADEHISFDAVYTGESWKLNSGGIDQGSDYIDNLDLQLAINTAKWGHDSGTFFFYGMYNNSSLFNDTRVGSHQGISNIENTRLFRLEEAWYEQVFNSEKASIKVGLIDLNSEFDAIDPAGFFINPSHGIGPDYSQSGLNGPSIFPNTSMALRLNLDFGEGWAFRSGIFDAEPNSAANPRRHEVKFNKGALLANEINKTFDSGWRLGLGTWRYTKELERIRPSDSDGNANSQGAYAFAHGAITQDTEFWLRYGEASTSTNPLESYLGVGLLKSAPFGRADDQLGFAIAHARNGGSFMDAEAAAGNKMDRVETNFELSYRYQVCGNFALQPDIQYIINPGTSPDAGNALILGLRFELSYSL